MVFLLISKEYLSSKMCREEFNIAVLRHREMDEKVLLPLYLQSTTLPSYMRILQYSDCREADEKKLREASEEIIRCLELNQSFTAKL